MFLPLLVCQALDRDVIKCCCNCLPKVLSVVFLLLTPAGARYDKPNVLTIECASGVIGSGFVIIDVEGEEVVVALRHIVDIGQPPSDVVAVVDFLQHSPLLAPRSLLLTTATDYGVPAPTAYCLPRLPTEKAPSRVPL